MPGHPPRLGPPTDLLCPWPVSFGFSELGKAGAIHPVGRPRRAALGGLKATVSQSEWSTDATGQCHVELVATELLGERDGCLGPVPVFPGLLGAGKERLTRQSNAALMI